MAQALQLPSHLEEPTDQDLLSHLPSSNERHWLPRHKAAVVTVVRSGLLTIEEARKRYRLTEEEFYAWKEAFDQKGLPGLQAGPRERRSALRQVVSEPGVATLHAGVQVECVITHVSDAGVRLRFGTVISLPELFEVHCKRSGRSWWVNKVWQSDRVAGARFNNPLPPPWIITSGLAAWLIGKRRTVCIDRIDAA